MRKNSFFSGRAAGPEDARGLRPLAEDDDDILEDELLVLPTRFARGLLSLLLLLLLLPISPFFLLSDLSFVGLFLAPPTLLLSDDGDEDEDGEEVDAVDPRPARSDASSPSPDPDLPPALPPPPPESGRSSSSTLGSKPSALIFAATAAWGRCSLIIV